MGTPFYNKDDVEKIPITEVLSDFYGITAHRHGGRYVCAIRKEKTESCHIYLDNTYCDFGNGNEGGTVITLVQRMEDLSWQDALEKLAVNYGIEPVKLDVKGRAELTQRQYELIGIYGDLATKNFDINVEKFGVDKCKKFAEKYYMSVPELAEKYPVMYHKMLKHRALPYLETQRNLYYKDILHTYRWKQEFGLNLNEEDFAKLEDTAVQLRKAERILSRVIKDPSLLQFKTRQYDPQTDLPKVLSGEIQYQDGSILYQDLKAAAAKRNAPLGYQTLPYREWFQVQQRLENTPHSAYVKKDQVNVCFLEKDRKAVETAITGVQFLTREKSVVSAR